VVDNRLPPHVTRGAISGVVSRVQSYVVSYAVSYAVSYVVSGFSRTVISCHAVHVPQYRAARDLELSADCDRILRDRTFYETLR
jgi:hypothetical protein